jgi:hypothetical protein
MGIITTASFPKALVDGVKHWFGNAYKAHKTEFTDIFDMEVSDRNYEEEVQIISSGFAPVKAEGSSIYYDTENQGFIARYVHVAYGIGFIVTLEQIEDNIYMNIGKRRAESLAFSMIQTKETVAANVLNRAFNSSYTGGDGTELIASTHSTVGGYQSNILSPAADLSEQALRDLVIQIMEATNDRKMKIPVKPVSLIVPPALWFDAVVLTKSILTPGTVNNAINPINSEQVFTSGVKSNHYLTDTDAFFIKTDCPRGMVGYTRQAVKFTEDNDFDTENFKAKAYERYAFGFTDWRGMYGSPGA